MECVTQHKPPERRKERDRDDEERQKEGRKREKAREIYKHFWTNEKI